MPKTKVQKAQITSDLAGKVAKIKSVVFLNYSGLKVSAVNKLRNECRKNGLDYIVVKRTLLKRAMKEAGSEIEIDELPGSMALVFSYGDEIAPSKVVQTFAKDNEATKILGGILENKIIAAQMVVELAKLPSREELLAKMLGSISAPLSGLVNVLQGNIRGLVIAINAIKEKKSV